MGLLLRTVRLAIQWAFRALRSLLAALFHPASLAAILLLSAGFVHTYHPEHVPDLDESPEEMFGDFVVYTGNSSTGNPSETTTTVLSGGEEPTYTVSTDSGFNNLHDTNRARLGDYSPANDTDGDGLRDAYERNQSGTDPRRKTLLVRVFDGTGNTTLSHREETRLIDLFADMPVKNPDGSTGIELVILSTNQLVEDEQPIVISNQTEKAQLNTRELYREEIPASEHCKTHMVTLVNITSTASFNGFANSPGYSAIVDSRDPGESDSVGRASRLYTIVHELLHNIVGEIGDSGSKHTSDGWLSGDPNLLVSERHHMTQPVAQDLTNGFYTDSEHSAVATC